MKRHAHRRPSWKRTSPPSRDILNTCDHERAMGGRESRARVVSHPLEAGPTVPRGTAMRRVGSRSTRGSWRRGARGCSSSLTRLLSCASKHHPDSPTRSIFGAAPTVLIPATARTSRPTICTRASMWSAFARGWDQPDRDSRSSIDAKHEGPASTFTLAMSWSLGSWAGRMVPARRTCWACSMRRASRSDAPQETNRCSGAGLDRSAIALSPRRSTGSIGASSAGQFCPIATLRSCYLGIKPYAYQWKGAEFLARTGRALLADEMGLSKTVQAILAAAAMRSASRPARGVTIVCPASLRGGWEEEIHRCLGECAVLLEGISEERARTIASRPASLVTHYEQVLRDLCLGEGRKAVVFSEWTDMTDRAEALCRRLRLPVFHLHGGVSVRSRPALLRGFTDQKGPAVFVSTDAGGVGAQSPD